MKKISLSFILIITVCTLSAKNVLFSVVDYGAKGNGQDNDTQAIQTAIDRANADGGGVVLFPAGQYVSGSIILKDYVTLRFESGAILLGSLNLDDYPAELGKLVLNPPYVWRGPLIYAENARYIGIEGSGIIDGRGTREAFPPFPRENQRPGLIRFKDCRYVTVKEVTLRNPACWTFHLKNCEDVVVRNIRMNSNSNRNNDGIDVDECRRVLITGCNLNTEDDAIVLKSFSPITSSDIVISDCILTSTCSAIKIGTETVGNFSNISISNCVIYGSRGIGLFSVDGSTINNVAISNISMLNSKSAIQLRCGARMRPYTMPKDLRPTQAGYIRNIMIHNLQAVIGHDRATTGMDNSQNFISGIPGHEIENLTLSNVSIAFHGNGTLKQAQREIPEELKAYPKSGMFGDLPAYGFYIRHVAGMKLDNVHLDILNEDLRPAIMVEKASDIELSGCLMDGNTQVEPLIKLKDVDGAVIRSCRPKNEIRTFVGVQGKSSKDIILQDNILHKARISVEQGKEVKSNSVTEINNIR